MEIEGHPNYLIYPDGRVWSNYRGGRYLKHALNGVGYPVVGFYKDKKNKQHTIHRLLAQYYIPNPDNKPYVDHINRNRQDNRLENLRWATVSENCLNSKVPKNNKLTIKNISYIKGNKVFRYKKMKKGVIHLKDFKMLEDAIEYKRQYELV